MRWWWMPMLVGCTGLTALGDGPVDPGDTTSGDTTSGDTTDTTGGEDSKAPPVDDGVSVTGEDCGNRRDDNQDGLRDCEDPTCLAVCDLDGDGQVAAPLGGADCDDGNNEIYDGADEICDGYDNDCDAAVDDDDDDVVGAPLWYADRDGDGYGDAASFASACDSGPVSVAGRAGDCDDTNAAISPGIREQTCDNLDNDCSAATPDAADGDGDGHGACDDCNDADGTIFPGAPEVCDGIDSNCDNYDCNIFADGFESGTISASWTTFGAANWSAATAFHHNGGWAASSGNIGDNQISTLQLVVDTPSGGRMSFWHRESTESCCDYLHLIIDGAEIDSWAGVNVWAQEQIALSAGSHEIKWRYEKDMSLDAGTDTVWLDDVLIQP